MHKPMITAILGPTNTGKTHLAIERMLGHQSGIIGLPLRLLAREVYDKIVQARGPSVVALITGEERIIPERTQYWVCTVEAMPQIATDFLAIDEIQLCSDPERGHVFTNRLLHARGAKETIFMGASTIRPLIENFIPDAQITYKDRLSQLTYSGSKKISRLPKRSAIVGFSVDACYAMAELLRRTKGGAAVVMGALSPRTRNAQVALYQNGDVDYLVATDAIGMGLNLDIKHVAFSNTVKFDGQRMRQLIPQEMAQIAGRAGRHLNNGTFGVTGEAGLLSDPLVHAIEQHQFAPLERLQWRNHRLEFASTARLIQSLEAPAPQEHLSRTRECDDLKALKALAQDPEITAKAKGRTAVSLLWDICQIPDFRGISATEHAQLLSRMFQDIHHQGRIDENWLALQVARIDRTDGDIDTLSKRLAYIRTWTYVSQRKHWLSDEKHWREHTRAVEDRLSDALHQALTQRFVDRRTSILLRRLKQKERLLADVNEQGEVTIDGEFVGKLEGFRFQTDKTSSPDEAKTLRQASTAALQPHWHLAADRFYNAPDPELDITEQGGLMWGELAVGKLVKGPSDLKPNVEAFVDEEAGSDVLQKVSRRLQHFVDRKIAAQFEPLLALKNDDTLTGTAKGLAFQLVENFGIMPRKLIADELKQLDQDMRGTLRKHGVRFGQYTIFMPLLLKPAPTQLRLLLWSLAQDLSTFAQTPPAGHVTIETALEDNEHYFPMAGYVKAGERAVRIDMLERLADMLRTQDSRTGFEANTDMLSITGTTLEQLANILQALGYQAEKGERVKVKAPPQHPEAAETTDNTQSSEQSRDAEQGNNSADAAASNADLALPEETQATPAEETNTDTSPTDKAPEDITKEPLTMEVFYTFKWGGTRPARPAKGTGAPSDKPRKSKAPRKKGPAKRDNSAKSFSAKPQHSKKVDPDNPFAAALAGLMKD